MKNPSGLCQCGCGQKTAIPKWNNAYLGLVAGQPKQFIHGHNKAHFKGYRTMRGEYIGIYQPTHPKAQSNGYVMEHILVAERVLGRPLKSQETVHHLDGNKTNNSDDNIYIFCTGGSHHKHHQSLTAFRESGHWGWRKCCFCHNYDDPKNDMYVRSGPDASAYHRSCRRIARAKP